MKPTPLSLRVSIPVTILLLLSLLTLLRPESPAWSSQSSPPPASLNITDHTRQSDNAAYNKPIIFFDENSTILVFYPNGDIIYRGRKLTRDYEVVRALQEILSLSPCRRTN